METSENADWTEARVIAVIRALAAEGELPDRLQAAPMTGDDTAETLGLDSIGALSLIERLEEDIGVALPDDFLTLNDSVATIAARVRGLAG